MCTRDRRDTRSRYSRRELDELKGKDCSINSINFDLFLSRLISERVRATMSRVPDEAVAQAASVPFVPSGGDQTGIVLQR